MTTVPELETRNKHAGSSCPDPRDKRFTSSPPATGTTPNGRRRSRNHLIPHTIVFPATMMSHRKLDLDPGSPLFRQAKRPPESKGTTGLAGGDARSPRFRLQSPFSGKVEEGEGGEQSSNEVYLEEENRFLGSCNN